MLQLIALVLIYGAMMFIWTFVFLNRSHDKVNQAFLVFLSNILVWMVLNNLADYGDATMATLVSKTVYWLSMMYLSVTFLLFVYRLLKKKIDRLFFAASFQLFPQLGMRGAMAALEPAGGAPRAARTADFPVPHASAVHGEAVHAGSAGNLRRHHHHSFHRP